MRVRKLDTNGDYSFGRGQQNLWVNVPDAPAQKVKTRLGLFTNEWFLDRTAGTPWNTKVLGVRTGATRDAVIQARTLGTLGVTGITSYSSTLNRDTRAYDVNLTINTAYGGPLVVNLPGTISVNGG